MKLLTGEIEKKLPEVRMGRKTLIERKEESLKHLHSIFYHLEKLPEEVWLQHLDVFNPVLKGLSGLRWELNQIDKIDRN